jgi:hypothetical protein
MKEKSMLDFPMPMDEAEYKGKDVDLNSNLNEVVLKSFMYMFVTQKQRM